MKTLQLTTRVALLAAVLALPSLTVGQAATFNANPNPVVAGQTITFTGNPVIPVTVSNARVTLWFYNSSGGYLGSASKRVSTSLPGNRLE